MLSNSTARLEVNRELPNYGTPWAVGGTRSSSATVTVICYQKKIYFVTNAHAVMDSTYLKIKLNRNSTEISLEKCWVDPILDLALLKATTEDVREFLEKELEPLEITSEFQKQGTEVYAYGYPSGGRNLSFTKGNISRVEITTMALSQHNAITVQTSAPINPGNSGGPITCLIGGKEVCIGIVAQGNSSLQNTGYFIPASSTIETIERYEKYKHLKEKGFIDFITVPDVGFDWQSLKNKPLRQALGLPEVSLGEEPTGIRVSSIADDSCAFGLLQEGDIIQAIDGLAIQSNGEIKSPELEHPIAFRFVILRKEYLSALTLQVQRKNEAQELETKDVLIPLKQQLGQYLSSPKYPAPLKYHIQPSGKKGGYVFIRYTYGYKQGFYNAQNPSVPPFFSGLSLLSKKEVREVVILQNIIPSEETDGYNGFAVNSGAGCISDYVTEANGKLIKCLFDLVTALSDSSKMSEVKFANGRVIYIAPAHPDVIENLKNSHKVTFFTSRGLTKVDSASVIEEIKSLGAREDNRFSFLKSV